MVEKIDIAKTVNRYTDAVKTVESPIELLFQVNFSGYFNSSAQLIPQYELITKRGRFRADFMFIPPSGERIIIECDGKEFHDPLRDSFRDAFILGSDCADAIYRIKGETIYSELSRVIEYILLEHNDALTDKAVNKFKMRSNDASNREEIIEESRAWQAEIEERAIHHEDPHYFDYERDDLTVSSDSFNDSVVDLFHRTANIIYRSAEKNSYEVPFGMLYRAFAKENKGLLIDDLISLWRNDLGELYEGNVYGLDQYIREQYPDNKNCLHDTLKQFRAKRKQIRS